MSSKIPNHTLTTPAKNILMTDRQFITHKPRQYDKTLPLIIAGVLILHVLAFTWIAYFDQTPLKPTLRTELKRITVQTVSLKPPASHPTSSTIAAASKAAPASTPPKESLPSEVSSQFKEMPSTLSPPPPKLQPQAEQKKPPSTHSAAAPNTTKPKPSTATTFAKKTPPPKPAATPKNPPSKTPPPKSPPAKPTASKPELKPESKPTPKPDPKIAAEQAAKEAAIKKQAEEQAVQAQAAKERQQAFLSQAQERIAKIAPSHDKLATNQTAASIEMTLPGPISNLKVDDVSSGDITPFGEREVSYREELASRMKLLLRLPQYGDVKMKLTLDRNGKVISVVISSAQNANNRKYIEKTVPTLSFPSFGSHFGTEAQHTFSITLSNDL